MSTEETAEYLSAYTGGKARLWRYHASHSRLVVSVTSPQQTDRLDLLFVSVSTITCPVLWTLGEITFVKGNRERWDFRDVVAGVTISFSDICIVIQDGVMPYLGDLDLLNAEPLAPTDDRA